MSSRQPDQQNSKPGLSVRKGVVAPPNVNPDVFQRGGLTRKRQYSVDEYVEGIIAGNRTILSQAITMAESSLPGHYDIIQEVIEKSLPYSSKSIRIGITGVPGAGKSTFIESFGIFLTDIGRKVAVLAIDPSSGKTKGSILGDKTRMEKLSADPNAFIRPSPAAGTLGGVARKTRESIILCEAGGFDTILVETVGVGQSEIAVHSMVDFFLLLMLAGAGDELQGIKRGIMEMADAVAITKADGSNSMAAEGARVLYQNALNLFPLPDSKWKPEVMTCSSFENKGIGEVWNMVSDYVTITKKSGYFDKKRIEQSVIRMNDTIAGHFSTSFNNNTAVKRSRPDIEQMLADGRITSYKAAMRMIDIYNNSQKD